MRSSTQAYFKGGFGCAAVFDEAAVCWCTAEYVSDNRCGIGIETVADHQGNGIATASRFVQMALDRQCAPHWECDGTNQASRSIAEKLGFRNPVHSDALTEKFE